MRRFLPLLLAVFLLWPVAGLAQGLANNQVPPTTPYGAPNLNYHWIEGGGARLHYKAVTYPKQVRLAGLSYQDPAAVPYLKDEPCNPCGKRKYTGKRKAYKKKAKVTKRKKKVTRKKLTPKKQPNSSAKLGPVAPKEAAPTVPMKAVDPVGDVPPERLQ